MFERLLVLYKSGKIDEVTLDIAVGKHWIMEDEKELIIMA